MSLQDDYMIYFRDDDIIVRDMVPDDAGYFAQEEIAQGWNSSEEKYLSHIEDVKNGKAVSLVAVFRGSHAGYINVYPDPASGPFAGKGYPEIVDFGVLVKFRRKGIGSVLMDAAEKVAGRYSDTVCLAVGLHNGYGSAQRMYVKRGYIPDGSGVWYKGKPCTPYDNIYTNDDDLVLFMSKTL